MSEEKIDTSKHPVILRLVQLQGDESDERFSRLWLPFSSTTWFRLKKGQYGADAEKLLGQCESAIRLLDDYAAASSRRGDSGRVLALSHVDTLLNAVKLAQVEPRDRLVALLAPTGGGKSTSILALKNRYGARVYSVEATESWRESYLAAASAIARVVGIKDAGSSKRLAETALLEHLKINPCIIVIDEAHYFGPSTVNLIKAILNQTQCVVVILAIPALWDRIKTLAWVEAEQLRSRTVATIRADQVDRSDASDFVCDRIPQIKAQLGADWKAALDLVVKAANRFGRFSTISRVCAAVRAELAGGAATLDMIADSIALVERTRG